MVDLIISLCGPHASGKSTVIRSLLQTIKHLPIYGLLGPRVPEAYICEAQKPFVQFHLLGPYNKPTTAGADYITKRGVDELLRQFEYYTVKKLPVLFEAALTSKRFGRPGDWLVAHKAVIARLDVSLDDCRAGLVKRREASTNYAGPLEKALKTLTADYRQFQHTMDRYAALGCDVRLVKRDAAPDVLLKWMKDTR